MFVIYGFKLRVVINLDLHKFFVEFTFFFNLDEGPIEKNNSLMTTCGS